MENQTSNMLIAGAIGLALGYLLFKPMVNIQKNTSTVKKPYRPSKSDIKIQRPTLNQTQTTEEESEFCGCGG